jgi:hypothetical protein
MESQIRDDQISYSLTMLQEEYQRCAACEKKSWLIADERAQPRIHLGTRTAQARKVLQHMDRQGMIAPEIIDSKAI